MNTLRTALTQLLFLTCSLAPISAAEVNILEEGNFDVAKGGMPVGFRWAGFAGDASVTPNRFELITENNNQFVRLTVPPSTSKQIAFVEVKDPIPLAADWGMLDVSAKIRVKDYVQGDQPWQGAKVLLKFYGSDGQPIGGDVSVATLKENTPEWTTLEKNVRIPTGSQSFKVSAGMMGSSGIVDIDDLSVTPGN